MDATVANRPELREAIAATGPTRLELGSGRPVLAVLAWDRRTGTTSVVSRTYSGRLSIDLCHDSAFRALPTGTSVIDALAQLAGVVIDEDGRLTRAG